MSVQDLEETLWNVLGLMLMPELKLFVVLAEGRGRDERV